MTIRAQHILKGFLFTIVIIAVMGTLVEHRSKEFEFVVRQAGLWCAGDHPTSLATPPH